MVGRAPQDRLNDPINLDDGRIPEGGTPGYATLNVRGRVRASRQLQVFIAGNNLTNELVLEHGSGFYRAGTSATLGAQLTLE